MAEIGRILWIWFWHNQRPIPKTKTEWLATQMILCIAGVGLQILAATLQPRVALVVLIGAALVVVLLWASRCLDTGVLTWALFALVAAAVTWFSARWFAPIISFLLLMFGVLVFDTMGSKAHNQAVERLHKIHNGSIIKTLIPGPALTCVWLWSGGDLDGWITAPVAGFVLSTLHIFGQKIRDRLDSRQDPHSPA